MSQRYKSARVAKVETPTRLIINIGTDHGVRMGQRYLVYALRDEDIIDPVTKKRLGKLEVPKGTGKVINVEHLWAMIESDTLTDNPLNLRLDRREEFDRPKVGDLVKPV
jgi:hypothetical protein